MTSTVTEVTLTTIMSDSFAARSTTVGIIVILLLLILLTQKELMRAFDKPQPTIWTKAWNIAIVPLLLMFSLIIVMRIVALL